jgi:hypothetical protein
MPPEHGAKLEELAQGAQQVPLLPWIFILCPWPGSAPFSISRLENPKIRLFLTLLFPICFLGIAAVPGFPALALPTSPPAPAPAPSRPSPSINPPPQSTSNPSNSSSVGPPSSDPSSSNSSSNTGLIVGVTCGIVAAVAVALCCLAFVCCKRRRRKAPERDPEKESSFGKVTPFTSTGLSPWRPSEIPFFLLFPFFLLRSFFVLFVLGICVRGLSRAGLVSEVRCSLAVFLLQEAVQEGFEKGS